MDNRCYCTVLYCSVVFVQGIAWKKDISVGSLLGGKHYSKYCGECRIGILCPGGGSKTIQPDFFAVSLAICNRLFFCGVSGGIPSTCKKVLVVGLFGGRIILFHGY